MHLFSVAPELQSEQSVIERCLQSSHVSEHLAVELYMLHKSDPRGYSLI